MKTVEKVKEINNEEIISGNDKRFQNYTNSFIPLVC